MLNSVRYSGFFVVIRNVHWLHALVEFQHHVSPVEAANGLLKLGPFTLDRIALVCSRTDKP